MDKNWKPVHRTAQDAPAKKTPTDTHEEANMPFDPNTVDRGEPSKKSSGPNISRFIKIAAAIIILGVLFVALLLPGLKGYGVYKAMKKSGVPETYATDMAGFQQAKTQAENQAAQAALDVAACKQAQSQAEQAQAAAESEVQKYLTAADTMQAERDSCLDAQKDFEETIADAANRLCCISRFTNSAISGYSITDNSVTCVTDGGESLSC